MIIRQLLTTVLRRTGLYHPLHDLRRDWRFRRLGRARIREWEARGRPAPPPDIVKYRAIRDLALHHGTRVLVETGTFYGNAIFTLRHDFPEIHSIELAPALHELNVRELGHLRHIHLHLGDSAVLLPEITRRLNAPALFWLDGHYCSGPSARADKDTPISDELGTLFSRPPGGDVVLIDDARLFTGRDGYPSLADLRAHVAKHRPQSTFTVEDDIIRIAPV